MVSMHRRKVAISLLLVSVLLALNFTNLEGLTGKPERRTFEIDHDSEANKQQSDDTVRIDPLDNFKKYRGGFDITNIHYLSSTIFTGIYGYAIAIVWLLCGFGYGIYFLASICCCKRKNIKLKKRSTCYNKHCYLWPILSATFLTILAIMATGLILGGNAKLHSRTNTVLNIIIDTANGASETIYTTTRALRDMNNDLEDTDIGDLAANFLIPTSTSLETQAADIHREANKHRLLIEEGSYILYMVTTLTISLNWLALIALTVFGILKIRRTLHLLIAVCWIFTVLCWLLFGIYYFIDNFAGDTCTTLESFHINPYNNSLSSMLPCDELLPARTILYDVGEGIHRVVDMVNRELSTNYGNVAQICNPFSGPPDYNFKPDQNCPSSAIRIGDLPQVIKMLTCTDPNCKGGVLMMSRRDFNNIEAYTTALKKILDVYPGIRSLAEFNTVYSAFADILDKHCEPLKKNTHMIWGGLVFLSVVMTVLVLMWTFEAQHEQNYHNLDSSIRPHSIAVDMLELGTVKERLDSNHSLVR